MFKNFSTFTNCLSEISDTQVDDAQCGGYSKTSGSLWKYYNDEPALENNNKVIDFPANKDNKV